MAELSAEDISPSQIAAMLASMPVSPPSAPEMLDETADHDAYTGHKADDQPAEAETPGEQQDEQRDEEPANSDEFERGPLDEEVRQFSSGDKRMRLTGVDPDGVKAVLLMKRNPDAYPTMLSALIHVRGEEAIRREIGIGATDAPAAVENTPAAVEVDPLEALQAEVDTLKKEVREHRKQFEFEEADDKEDKLDAARELLMAAKFAKSAPPAPAPPAPTLSDSDFSRLFEADAIATVQKFPDAGRVDSPLRKEMEAEQARLAQAGDPLATAWDINSRIAEIAATRLNLQPQRATVPVGGTSQNQPRRAAPGPVQGNRSGAQPVRVDEARIMRSLTPEMLRGMLTGIDD